MWNIQAAEYIVLIQFAQYGSTWEFNDKYFNFNFLTAKSKSWLKGDFWLEYIEFEV